MRNLTKALTVVSLLAPVSGYTLGIGDIRVRSALNQKLNAEISLIVSPNENPNSIKVSLAPPERFDSAGVSWSYFLSKIRFKPIVKPNGSVVVKVTSTEALKEPYLNFLLEVTWPKGNLYREFTVLVDPPTEYQAPSYQAEPVASDYTPQEPRYTPRPRPAYDRPAVRRTVAHPRPRPPVNSAGHFGGQVTAHRNDTLWRVAARAKGGSDVSVEQMMMALYANNPSAFYSENVNALSAGKTLHVPAKSDVQQLSRQQALAEFARHNQAWANHSPVPEAEETQVAKEQPAENQLKLEAPTESTVAGNEKVAPSSTQAAGGAALPNPLANATGTDGTSTETPAKLPVNPAIDAGVQSKIDALQKQLETMQQIIALKDKQLADLQNAEKIPPVAPNTEKQPQPPIESKPAEPTPIAVQPPQATAQQKPAETVSPVPVQPKPEVKPPVLPPEAAAKESDSSYLGIIGGTVLAFMGMLGWIWWRKQKMLAELDAESMFGNYSIMRTGEGANSQPGFDGEYQSTGGQAGSMESNSALLADESSFLNDFKASDFETFETFNVDHGDIDPVAEADVYLAYGRYQQAEDLMREAVKNSPERDECKLKLLEILQVSGNKDGFTEYAAELQAAGKNSDRYFWDKVCELGQEILPEEEMFATDNTPAVFAEESEVITESILVRPPAEPVTPTEPVVEQSPQGAAQFDADDALNEESTFASALFNPHAETEKVGTAPENGAHIKPQQAASTQETDSDELDLSEFTDNDPMDFNLGPYPGGKIMDSATNSSERDKSLFSGTTSSAPSENAIASNELDTYDFDMDFEKPAASATIAAKGLSTDKPSLQDAWDPDQTIDFSFDMPAEKGETADVSSPSLDFNFDVDIPTDAPPSSRKGDNMPVSDLTDMDEIETKLDLAKAYVDMGDPESARDIISQVIEKGNDEQKKLAQLLLEELS